MKVRRIVKDNSESVTVTEIANARINTACAMVMEFGEKIPAEFTDNLYAWKKLGNPWCSGIEANTSTYKAGITFENEIGNNDCLRALVYFGYMVMREWVASNLVSRCRQYKLTDKGIAAVKRIAQKIGDTEELIEHNQIISIECSDCEGIGVDSIGETCGKCKGEGVIKPTRSRRTKAEIITEQLAERSSNMIVSSSRETKGTPPVVTSRRARTVKSKVQTTTCVKCAGTGEYRKKECPVCEGIGEITVK